MPRSHRCPSSDRVALLLENKLLPEEREELLRHVMDCNECAMEYTLLASLLGYAEDDSAEDPADIETARSQCPGPEVFSLLLENKLDETERTKVLLHIASCNECALAYTLVSDMRKEPIAKPKTIWVDFRYLAKAAAIVLLAGACFTGGFLSAGRARPLAYNPEKAYAQFIKELESSSSYWNTLNALLSPTAATGRIGAARGAQELSIREIWAKKQDFDLRLSEIKMLSGQNLDVILSVGAVDILTMSSEDIEIYAELLKEGRVEEMRKAEQWIMFNQSAYFALAKKLPPDVWEHYPPNEQSLDTLFWIAGLSEDIKKEVLTQLIQEGVNVNATSEDEKPR